MPNCPRLWLYSASFVLAASAALSLLFLGGSTGCWGSCFSLDCTSSTMRFVDEHGEPLLLGEYEASLLLGEERIDLGSTLGEPPLVGNLAFALVGEGILVETLGENFYRGPIEVTVRTANGEHRETFTPQWTSSEINGEGCEPVCGAFEGTLRVPRALWVDTSLPQLPYTIVWVSVWSDTSPTFDGPDLDAVGLRKPNGELVFATELLEPISSSPEAVELEKLLGPPDVINEDGTCRTKEGGTIAFDQNGDEAALRFPLELAEGDELLIFDAGPCVAPTEVAPEYRLELCFSRDQGGCEGLVSVVGRGVLSVTMPRLR